MPDRLRQADLVELLKALSALRTAIEAGELSASAQTRLRIEGAVVALEELATRRAKPRSARSPL